MIKKIIMILVLLVFALTLFSETSADHEKVQKKKHVKQDFGKHGKTLKNEPKVIEIQIACKLDKLSEYLLKKEKSKKGKSVKIDEHFYLFHTKGTYKKRPEKVKPEKKKAKSIAEFIAKSIAKSTKHLSEEKAKFFAKSIAEPIAKSAKHLSKKKAESFAKSIAKFYAKSAEHSKPLLNYVSTGMDRGQQINWTCRFPFTIFYGGRSILTTDPLGWARPGRIISYLQGVKRGENWYQTPDAWIINNALNGAYKYIVSVYIPEADIVYVDDPETIVRPPK